MPQQPEIIVTKDGSHTLKSAVYGAEYHSVHGAIQESMHVFINAGLLAWLTKVKKQTVQIFEMGLGTGLNAFLTLLEAEKQQVKVNYTAIEAYPIDWETANQLNYLEKLACAERKADFKKIHACEWATTQQLTEYFSLTKIRGSLLETELTKGFDIIYYDAFAPGDQPELWTAEVFSKLYELTSDQGMLLTYCAKGDVKRALQSAGWIVEKLPGPPGKREMIRAIKP